MASLYTYRPGSLVPVHPDTDANWNRPVSPARDPTWSSSRPSSSALQRCLSVPFLASQWLPVRQSHDDGTIKNPRLPLLVATLIAPPSRPPGFFSAPKVPPSPYILPPNNTIAEEAQTSHLFGSGCCESRGISFWFYGRFPFHPVFLELSISLFGSGHHCNSPSSSLVSLVGDWTIANPSSLSSFVRIKPSSSPVSASSSSLASVVVAGSPITIAYLLGSRYTPESPAIYRQSH